MSQKYKKKYEIYCYGITSPLNIANYKYEPKVQTNKNSHHFQYHTSDQNKCWTQLHSSRDRLNIAQNYSIPQEINCHFLHRTYKDQKRWLDKPPNFLKGNISHPMLNHTAADKLKSLLNYRKTHY